MGVSEGYGGKISRKFGTRSPETGFCYLWFTVRSFCIANEMWQLRALTTTESQGEKVKKKQEKRSGTRSDRRILLSSGLGRCVLMIINARTRLSPGGQNGPCSTPIGSYQQQQRSKLIPCTPPQQSRCRRWGDKRKLKLEKRKPDLLYRELWISVTNLRSLNNS